MSSSPAKKSSPVTTVEQQPTKKQPRVRRKVRALDYPKRPLSAYNLFFKSEQPVVLAEYKRQHDGEVDFPTIVKLVARRWKQLGEVDRFKYEEMAERNSDEYRQELWEYQKGKKKEKLEAKKRKAASSLPPKKAVLTTANNEECDSSVTVEDDDDDDSSIEVVEEDEDLPHAPPGFTKKNRSNNNKNPKNSKKGTQKKPKPVEVEDISSREEEQDQRDTSRRKNKPVVARPDDNSSHTGPTTTLPQAEAANLPTASLPPAVRRRPTVSSLPQGDLERVLLHHHQNRAREDAAGSAAVRGNVLGRYPSPPQQGRRVLMEQDTEVARNMLIQDLRAIEAARDETIHRLIQLEDDSPPAVGPPPPTGGGSSTTTAPELSFYQLIDHQGVPVGMRAPSSLRAGNTFVPPPLLLRGADSTTTTTPTTAQIHHQQQLPPSFLPGHHLYPPEATNPLLAWRRQL